jgi:hypothetical protein
MIVAGPFCLPQSAEVTEVAPMDPPSEADDSDTSSESSSGGYDCTRTHSPPPQVEPAGDNLRLPLSH